MPLCGTPLDIEICKGKTFSKILRWGVGPFIYKSITSITSLVPIRLNVPGHGLVNGWAVAVTGVKGTVELNAGNPNRLKTTDFHQVTVLDADNIELNTVNGANFSAYQSGGFIQYATPVDLSAYPDAAMQIRDKNTGELLADLNVGNGKIVLDNILKTILLTITDAETETYIWKKGIYDLELYTGATTIGLVSGNATTADEVTV